MVSSVCLLFMQWGCDLQKEHERHLVVYCGNIPVFITDYPSEIRPFYMKGNEDTRTVRGRQDPTPSFALNSRLVWMQPPSCLLLCCRDPSSLICYSSGGSTGLTCTWCWWTSGWQCQRGQPRDLDRTTGETRTGWNIRLVSRWQCSLSTEFLLFLSQQHISFVKISMHPNVSPPVRSWRHFQRYLKCQGHFSLGSKCP